MSRCKAIAWEYATFTVGQPSGWSQLHLSWGCWPGIHVENVHVCRALGLDPSKEPPMTTQIHEAGWPRRISTSVACRGNPCQFSRSSRPPPDRAPAPRQCFWQTLQLSYLLTPQPTTMMSCRRCGLTTGKNVRFALDVCVEKDDGLMMASGSPGQRTQAYARRGFLPLRLVGSLSA